MRSRTIGQLAAAAMLLGGAAATAEFEVRIISWPPEVPLGAPIPVAVDARNVSGHPVVVALSAPAGFMLRFDIRRLDGQEVRCAGDEVAQYFPGAQRETLPPDWHQVLSENVACDDTLGELVVQAILASQSLSGKYMQERAGVKTEFEAWTGEVRSREVHIRIVEPTGIDLEAYKYFKGRPLADTMRLGELLQKFPTSTYAAYVIFLHAGPPSINTLDEKGLSILLASLRTGILLTKEYPDDSPTSKRGWRSLSGEAAASWLAHWYEIILSNHPGLWFADELKLKRALDQLALHNMAEGEAQLAALAKEARPEIAEWSGQFLALVKQKGLVK